MDIAQSSILVILTLVAVVIALRVGGRQGEQ
jgi:hypothetical protein